MNLLTPFVPAERYPYVPGDVVGVHVTGGFDESRGKYTSYYTRAEVIANDATTGALYVRYADTGRFDGYFDPASDDVRTWEVALDDHRRFTDSEFLSYPVGTRVREAGHGYYSTPVLGTVTGTYGTLPDGFYAVRWDDGDETIETSSSVEPPHVDGANVKLEAAERARFNDDNDQ